VTELVVYSSLTNVHCVSFFNLLNVTSELALRTDLQVVTEASITCRVVQWLSLAVCSD